MTSVTKNLGLIKAIHVGTTSPINIKMLWYDDNVGVKFLKYYDTFLSSWIPLSNVPVGGYIPYISYNYIFVEPTDDPIVNGTRLLAAYAAAKLLTPNGLPLSSSNKSIVYLFAGIYNVDSSTFVYDEPNVSLIGVGGADSVIITSNNIVSTIDVSTSTGTFQDLTISNESGGLSLRFPNTYSSDFGTWNNVVILASMGDTATYWFGNYTNVFCLAQYCFCGSIYGYFRNCNFDSRSCGFSNNYPVEIYGNIGNCIGGNFCFGSTESTMNVFISSQSIINSCNGYGQCFGYSSGGAVNIQGLLTNCIATFTSFGYNSTSGGSVTISGEFSNCFSGGSSFGSAHSSSNCNVTISGKIIGCKSTGQDSFGFSGTGFTLISGEIQNCNAFRTSFGKTEFGSVTISGSIKGCRSTNDASFGNSFIGTVTISGFIVDCSSGGIFSFAASNNSPVVVSGKIDNCVCSGSDRSFGHSGGDVVTISGVISNIHFNGSQSFGSGSSESISGKIINCSATSSSFGSTTSTGIIKDCIRTSGYGIHAGTIDNCTFSDSSAGVALNIADGATVKYSTIYQAGAGDTISSSGSINAKIYQSSLNKVINALVTNLIVTPYNVVDSNVIV